MTVEHRNGGVSVTLDERETQLLRYALERALFIDTPVAQQVAIAAFCSRALELLAGGRA